MSERNALTRRLGLLGVLVVVIAILPGCGPESKEERIHRFIAKMVERAEEGDLEGIMDRLAPDYADFEGRDKEAAGALVSDYLRNRRGIVIHLLATRIEGYESEDQPRVRAEIMISSGAAEAFRRLVPLAGEAFRFDFLLESGGADGWLVGFAKWEQLPTGDLLPESVEALRKLFTGK